MQTLPEDAIEYRGHAIAPTPRGSFEVLARRKGSPFRRAGWRGVRTAATLESAKGWIDYRIERISKGNMTMSRPRPMSTPMPKKIDPTDTECHGPEPDESITKAAEALIEQNDAYDERKRTAHCHADKMAEYALDAQETTKPWERWEMACRDGAWAAPTAEMAFFANMYYRRKPRTININGFEVPEPLRTCPAEGTKVWVVTLVSEEGGVQLFDAQPYSKPFARLVERGLCHLNEDSAKAHADALLSFRPE